MRRLKWYKEGNRHIYAEVGIKAGKRKREHGMVLATIKLVGADLYTWEGVIPLNPPKYFRGHDLDVIKADIEAVFSS